MVCVKKFALRFVCVRSSGSVHVFCINSHNKVVIVILSVVVDVCKFFWSAIPQEPGRLSLSCVVIAGSRPSDVAP